MKPKKQKESWIVDILSPMGLTILTVGILFTVGVQLLMILKGRKD